MSAKSVKALDGQGRERGVGTQRERWRDRGGKGRKGCKRQGEGGVGEGGTEGEMETDKGVGRGGEGEKRVLKEKWRGRAG